MLDNNLFGDITLAVVVTAVLATILVPGGWLMWVAVLSCFGTTAWLHSARKS